MSAVFECCIHQSLRSCFWEKELLSERRRPACILLFRDFGPQGDITDEELRNHFSQYGEIQDSVVSATASTSSHLDDDESIPCEAA